MPFKSEKIKINHTKYDRRIKLFPEDKKKIISLYKEGNSIRGLAKQFKVDKRLIQFILFPERQKLNKKLRKERGGSKVYYDRKKWAETMKDHRNYKQNLYIKGKIK